MTRIWTAVGRLLAAAALCVAARGASAQPVGDEIVIPAGDFAKDDTGIVTEAGGNGGTGVERGAFRFPESPNPVVVGLSTRLPASWVGHEISVVFGGSAVRPTSAKFRIEGIVENTTFGLTGVLGPESAGTTEVTVLAHHVVPGRRFGIAIGRNPAHVGDPTTAAMNFEYLVLRRTN
jgi:hypothetical protein